jgi:hypothetical protein
MGMAKMEHLDPARLFCRSDGYSEITIILFHLSPILQIPFDPPFMEGKIFLPSFPGKV